MIFRVGRSLKLATCLLVTIILLSVPNDALRLTPAQSVASAYLYDLLWWEVGNFPRKWIHRVSTSFPWNITSAEEKRRQVNEYFRLVDEGRKLYADLDGAAAHTNDGARLEIHNLELDLEQNKNKRNSLRDDVEETIEATISAVLLEAKIASWGVFTFPPVDIRLSDPPQLLITSPRDRILRDHDVLLRPGIGVDERELLESEIVEGYNLSALVTDIGGLATYPAILSVDRSLQQTFQIASHEWLHHYFFFKPLGRNMFDSDAMRILNETVADIAGREIGDRAYQLMVGIVEKSEQIDDKPSGNNNGFAFGHEMRETRLKVDDLLAEGRIDDAEVYMEMRRRIFLENGYYIRKLNQAYFAFHGTYAESGASISPIGEQLNRLRDHMPDLGAFIWKIAGISSYKEFLDEMEKLDVGIS